MLPARFHNLNYANAARPRAASFDRLIGAGEERGRDLDPECLRGLEIEDQLELGRLI